MIRDASFEESGHAGVSALGIGGVVIAYIEASVTKRRKGGTGLAYLSKQRQYRETQCELPHEGAGSRGIYRARWAPSLARCSRG